MVDAAYRSADHAGEVASGVEEQVATVDQLQTLSTSLTTLARDLEGTVAAFRV
jgi:methyl-accepting chemotaxis protein